MKIFFILLFIPVFLIAQWSTSPFTQDAIFACPGFRSEVVSYPDGSSIIIGIGDHNEIWMQKFNSNGYKQWIPYVTVFPSLSGKRIFLPDDDGGVYAIVGNKAQRVDKNGNLMWGSNGLAIISSGSIDNAITDGQNGFIALQNHFDSLQRYRILRFDSTGAKLWDKQIDSSNVRDSIIVEIVGRLGQNTFLQFSNKQNKLINIYGNIFDSDITFSKNFFFLKETDSTAFIVQILSYKFDSLGWFVINEKIEKRSSSWDTIWTTTIEIKDEPGEYLNVGTPFLPDYLGGVFNFTSFYNPNDVPQTRIRRINQNGFIESEQGYLIKGLAGRQFFNSKGKLGFVTDKLRTQIVDTLGNTLWGDSLSVIQDYKNAFLVHSKSDNNGGAVVSFWTVSGGIKVQHTGRTGKVGILTKILTSTAQIPKQNILFQNYPNPFNFTTTFKFSITIGGFVEIKIYDAIGREIKNIIHETLSTGTYQIKWDAKEIVSGIYFYKLISNEHSIVKKMIIIK